MTGSKTYVDLVNEVRTEFPEFRIVNKEASTLMKVINFLLLILSFGLANEFMTGFITTIGYTVYVPDGWADREPLEKAETIRHERVHMRQRRRMGLVRFSLTYLFWIFPVGLAIGRRDLEQEAYAETVRASVEYYGHSVLTSKELRDRVIKHFVGAEYFWMWPFRHSIEAWYDSLILEVSQELSGHRK